MKKLLVVFVLLLTGLLLTGCTLNPFIVETTVWTGLFILNNWYWLLLGLVVVIIFAIILEYDKNKEK